MKQPIPKLLIGLLGMAMELCWLQAWAAFLFHWAFEYRTPVGFVLLLYVCGIITCRYASSRPRLRIQAFMILLIGFGAAVSLSSWLFLFRANVGHLPVNLSHMLDFKNSLASWGFATILLAVAITVWRRSKAHVRNPASLQNVYQRFDLGLAAFFSLLVIKLFCFARFDVALNTPDLRYLFLPFFLFGLLNIGVMLSHGNPERNYVSGFQRMGVALSFAMIMLCTSLAVVLLFHGQLTAMAENLSGILHKAGPPLSGAVVWVVRILWAPGGNRRKMKTSASDDLDRNLVNTDAASNGSWVSEVVIWGMTVFGIVVFAVVIFLVVRWLLRFLLTKTGAAPPENYLFFDWKAWFNSFRQLAKRLLHRITGMFREKISALEFWAVLLSWGRRSGIPHQHSDTLMEYGSKLAQAFPVLKKEIQLIVGLISQEVYGGISIHPQALTEARMAQRRMAHPRFWKLRVKAILFPKWNKQTQNDH